MPYAACLRASLQGLPNLDQLARQYGIPPHSSVAIVAVGRHMACTTLSSAGRMHGIWPVQSAMVDLSTRCSSHATPSKTGKALAWPGGFTYRRDDTASVQTTCRRLTHTRSREPQVSNLQCHARQQTGLRQKSDDRQINPDRLAS